MRELRDAASAIAAGCRELAQSCRDYKTALDELREKLADILEDFAIELAVGGTIAIATAFISFGASAVAGAANAARVISKFARIVTEAIAAWKLTKNITKGVKRAHDLAGARRKLQRIKNLSRKGSTDNTPSATPDAEWVHNIRVAQLDHIFRPGHNLENVVMSAGGREQAIRQILNALHGTVPAEGKFTNIVTLYGQQITVRGYVHDWVIKLGTAFLP
ncbi:hypothetical protein LV457_16260 [Mycobacterium sp. MYCO198283]|uniref:hypothetical protein n=1 Tax=Mycobacterium sp. MYCO198283 TaxID=2883505 RepID=UPI001E44DB0E|nr:hypothetical protein [Mycobacterium sp. MYCO198283]MCG5433830.1 hypothetical protein [Mycobacterium sp. MYCO198283]